MPRIIAKVAETMYYRQIGLRLACFCVRVYSVLRVAQSDRAYERFHGLLLFRQRRMEETVQYMKWY